MIGIVFDHYYQFFNNGTAQEFDEVIKIVRSGDYRFLVMFFINGCVPGINYINILPEVPKNKLRMIYGCECDKQPFSNGIPTTIQYCSTIVFENVLDGKDPYVYLSKIGFNEKSRFLGFMNGDVSREEIKRLSTYKKLFHYGTKTAGCLGKTFNKERSDIVLDNPNMSPRALQLKLIEEAGIDIVYDVFRSDKERLVDCLVRHECCGLVGVDGNSIQCHRDHEAVISGIPYFRVTYVPECYELVDHYGTAYLSSLYDNPASIKDKFNRMRDDIHTEPEKIIASKKIAEKVCKNIDFYHMMESLVCNRKVFYEIFNSAESEYIHKYIDRSVDKVFDPLITGVPPPGDPVILPKLSNKRPTLHELGLVNLIGKWKTTNGRTYSINEYCYIVFEEEYKSSWIRKKDGNVIADFNDGKLEIFSNIGKNTFSILHFDPKDRYPTPTLTATATRAGQEVKDNPDEFDILRIKSTEVYRMLISCDNRTEGNILENTDTATMRNQVNGLKWFLKQARPDVVLETGTNKGLFGLLVSELTNARKLYTFDIDARSSKTAKILSENTDLDVSFILGNSKTTLSSFSPNESIQFAWIDGGHSYDVCLSDLNNCSRLNIKYIAVDDTSSQPVHDACRMFQELNKQYICIESPYTERTRTIKFFKDQHH